ncbi:hypothetical protein [Salinibaculum rarum]|uniref:hypothetical protein n=1 Tax=Salinibaculum rarum TaxID=3058903 RepID=UPI00265E0FCC|nr:hypothetical protein [Salinibaculum sp. KK48]
MDTAQLRRELAGSVRLLWTRERWLWSGVVAVLVGYALWVGATGAALNYGAEFAGADLSVVNWSSTTTAVFALVAVIWVLLPAAVVTYLVDSYVTNVSGNVHTHYRVEHPVTLVVPMLALFAVGVGAAVAVGDVPAALAGALVAVGLLVLLRTIAYSYRVFSFSVPMLVKSSLFVSLTVCAVALLAGVGIVAGRRTFVEAAGAGVGDLLGTGGVVDVVTGTTTAGPVTVSTLLGAAAILPVGFAVGYLLLQSAVGLVSRVRKPDVPRSQLRTGQRYPEFAHPITGVDGGDTNSTTSGESPDTGADQQSTPTSGTTAQSQTSTAATTNADETGEDKTDESDDVSHTKVFTAPDDGNFGDDVPDVDSVPDADSTADTTGDDDAEETAVVGGAERPDESSSGAGYRCPTCAESFAPDTSFAYCPTCGTELQSE